MVNLSGINPEMSENEDSSDDNKSVKSFPGSKSGKSSKTEKSRKVSLSNDIVDQIIGTKNVDNSSSKKCSCDNSRLEEIIRGFEKSVEKILSDKTCELINKINILEHEVKNLKQTNNELVQLLKEPHKQVRGPLTACVAKPQTSASSLTSAEGSSSYSNAITKGSTKSVVCEKPGSSRLVETEPSQYHVSITSAAAPSDSNGEDTRVGNEGFTLVTNMKRKKKNDSINKVYGKSESAPFKGVAKLGHLHVYRLEPTVTAGAVGDYLKNCGFTGVTCEGLQSKYPDVYSSFKISCPVDVIDKIKDPTLWPAGVVINKFFNWIQRAAVQT